MRAAVLTVLTDRAEEVLDRVLPVLPGGLYERPHGATVELFVPVGDGGPTQAAIEAAAASALVSLAERELPDEPLERRRALYEAPVVGGRFAIHPPWAEPPARAPGGERLEHLVIDRGRAFGTGVHPTTRRCLELLLRLEPRGSFADLGCGTGVLAIAAARLGWSPVAAVDLDPAAVAATEANAARNGVAVEVGRRDLIAEPPPAAGTIAANAPPSVHEAIAARLAGRAAHVVVSGIGPGDAEQVAAAYAAHGLEPRMRLDDGEWSTQLLARADAALREAPASGAFDGTARTTPRPHITIPAAALRARGRPATRRPTGDEDRTGLAGQIATNVPGAGLALSAAREIADGMRAPLLLAPGLFRLDVQPAEDTFRVALRNLSGVPLRMRSERAPDVIVQSDGVADLRPLHTATALTVRLSTRPRPTEAAVTISALAEPERASTRITAQAVVRPALDPP